MDQFQERPDPMGASSLADIISLSMQDVDELKREEERRAELANKYLRDSSPIEIIDRLKGVLYRMGGVYKVAQMVHMEADGEMLTACLRTLTSAVVDAIKWIAWEHDIDPYDAFGDDTMVVEYDDLKLGVNLTENADDGFGAEHEHLLDATDEVEYDDDDDDLNDEDDWEL